MIFSKIRKKYKEGRFHELAAQWRWMGIYIRRYWLLVGFYTLLGASGSFLSLGTTMVSRSLVDAVTGYNTQNIATVACLYVGVGVGQIFINVIKQRISLRIRLKIVNEIRCDIFSQVMQTDWEALSGYSTGDLLYRMNGDAGGVANSILTFIPNLVSTLITFGGAFVVMLQNDPTMALIALGGAPISLLASRYSMRKMREYQQKNQEFSSSKMSFDQETFQNLQMIKAFDLVGTFTNRFRKIQDESVKISMDQNKYQSRGSILTSLVGQAIGYACYGFAVYRLWTGDVSYGTMTMLVGMAGSLRGSFSSVTGLLPTAIRAGISAGRVMELVEMPKEDRSKEQEAKKLLKKAGDSGLYLKMEDGAFWYEEDKPVYTHASFYGAPGEIIGLIGPSGQGKTTTFRLFLGLYALREGSLSIGVPGGESLSISSSTRCLFRYIPQGNTLFQGTIADNLKMMKADASEEELIRALKTACAWEFVEKLEHGVDTEVRELGQRFSEGQKQRISIARALLSEAPVLLLDEATSALDMDTERRVIANIVKNDPKRLIVVAAHRPSVFSVCDRIYRVKDGRFEETDGEDKKRLQSGSV